MFLTTDPSLKYCFMPLGEAGKQLGEKYLSSMCEETLGLIPKSVIKTTHYLDKIYYDENLTDQSTESQSTV